MAKIYMIEDGKNALLVSKLGFLTIPYSEKVLDAEFHNYVISIFENYDVEKLIIPVSLGNGGGLFRGLKLGMHIRLTREIGVKRLIPILFISDFDFDEIMMRAKNDYLNLNYLLLTEGVKLVENNEKMIKRLVESMTPIEAHKFSNDVLGRLKIVPTEIIGKHSLANQWGAFRLDEILQTMALDTKKALRDRQKELYFKFIRSLSDDLETFSPAAQPKTLSPSTLNSFGKRILLIDDEADKGWSDVLAKIFDKSDFQFISKNTFAQFYTDAKNRILNEDWDLILLDLRLNPEEEEKPAFIAEGNINNYSGAKLLSEIKTKNRGTQVIIFTASNKAWNMKSLLDLGADGYFIKESPESGFSYQFSKENAENFILNIDSCLNKGYLQDIYKRQLIIETTLLNKKGLNQDYDDFLDELKTQIDISYDLLYNANSETKFAYAYISLFRVLELIDSKSVEKVNNMWQMVKYNTNLINYSWDETNGRLAGGLSIYGNSTKPSPFLIIANVYLQSLPLNYQTLPINLQTLSLMDSNYLQQTYWATLRRNKYIHFDQLKPNQQNEVAKIHNKTGYLELLEVIENILVEI